MFYLRYKSKRMYSNSLKYLSKSNRKQQPRKPRIPRKIRSGRHQTNKLSHCPISHREALLLREL